MNFEERHLDNGIGVCHIITDKFKTVDVHVFVHQKLSRDTATMTALLPRVLRCGCDGFPTLKDINRRLDEMFGASIGAGVLKIGDRQIVHFNLQVLDPRFCPDKNILRAGLDLLSRVVLKPFSTNGAFSKEYVKQEKNILRQDIEALINDKYQYSMQRCIEETAGEDPYSLSELGKVSDLESIDGQHLSTYHETLLDRNPMEIFVVGDVNITGIDDLIEEYFGYDRHPGSYGFSQPLPVKRVEPRVVVEKQQVTQGKLCLGCTTGVHSAGEGFYPMVLYDGILGGYVHSKLFENVREKSSLAYYAQSYYVPSKGLVLIASGIEPQNYEKALDIIKRQMEDMREGNITDREYSYTVKALANRYRSVSDSAPGMVLSLLSLRVSERHELPWEQIEQINMVDPQKVREVAKKVTLDTVYFLTSEEKGEAAI